MTPITGEIVTGAPADVVSGFAAGQRNEPAYNTHMLRSAKVTPGPAGTGTRFRPAVRSRGRLAEMTIEYTGFRRPSRLAPATRMAQAEFSGTLTFGPAGAGTRLRRSRDARFTWPLRLLAPVLARVGGRQERATWAGLRRYLASSQSAAGPGAAEQPGPASAAAADGNGGRPPGQGRAGAALLAASVAGVALAPLALRRLGRGGSLLVAAGCGALFARDAQMTLAGAAARLRPLPQLLLRTEVPVSGAAAGAALLACSQQRPGVARVAAAAAAATFAVHAVREAIYLSPGHGSQEPAARQSPAAWDGWTACRDRRVLLAGFLRDKIAAPRSLATRRDVATLTASKTLIARRSRPADGRSHAYPPDRGDLPHAGQHARHPDPDILAAFAYRLDLNATAGGQP